MRRIVGIKRIPDFNTGDNEGSCVFHVNQKRGRRWSAARAFLKPVLKRANLRLELNCLVEKIEFEGTRAVAPAVTLAGSAVKVTDASSPVRFLRPMTREQSPARIRVRTDTVWVSPLR